MKRSNGFFQASLVFLAVLSAMLVPRAKAQTSPTNIQVNSTVLQPSVSRLGINLSDQTFYDSGQMLKNLIFQNPGFEGEKYRSIMICAATTANTCTDDNQFSPQTTGFWNGATYTVISGKSAGKTGTIVSSTQNPSSCSGCGQIIKFDQNINAAVGDYFVMTQNIPGNGDKGWWDATYGGGTITTETNDISPESPGKQAIALTAAVSGQSASMTQYFDNEDGLSFIQLNGAFAVTFRAKGMGGKNQLQVTVQRLGGATYLNTTVNLTNTWQDYTIPFSASENGTANGTVQVSLGAYSSSAELDDVSVAQTNSDPTNTSVFRDDVVNALKQLNPGTMRMMAGSALGSDIPNSLAVPFARYREGWSTGATEQDDIPYGIHEFLELCQTVGADPWITIPTATTPAEMQDFIEYLTGNGSDPWSALRISRGQVAPWTSVFGKIHVELGNETWNGSFRGESMSSNGYPQWANQVFGAARQTSGFVASKFDLVIDGCEVAGYDIGILQASTQHDSIDFAPYLLYSSNNEAMSTMFGALFAEPEMWTNTNGMAQQVMQAALTAPTKTRLNIYETNLSPITGNSTEAQLNSLTPSIGGGLGHTLSMLEMMRMGVAYQNAFSLPEYAFTRGDGLAVKLWGVVVDMGTTNRRRPQFITEAMANTAIGGNMLQTVQTGANPTWNQPLSSDSVQLSNAHYLQSFAYQNGSQQSIIVFNLNQATALPVSFSGANAPNGSVEMSQITSTNITDNNETASVVEPKTQTLSGFNAATGLSLPPFSMTVLTWTTSQAASTTTQAPIFSVASGTYNAAQTVSILNNAAATAKIYYTTNGATPNASSTVYSAPINVASSQTLQAIAVVSGNSSTVASATYTINPPAATPVLSVAAGSYASAQTVALTDATANATIYYTVDGSTPGTGSPVYSAPIKVSSTETLKAAAIAPNYTLSAVASAAYTINQSTTTTAAPVFSVASGTYSSGQNVTISDATAGATIYYTTNGSTPTTASAVYNGSIPVSSTTTLKAVAAAKNAATSAVTSASYTINEITAAPLFSVAAGSYTSAQTVKITDATTNAVIYYTTNGSMPTTASSVYSGPITVSATETLKAAAMGPGRPLSAVTTAAYTISQATAAPAFSLAAGVYTSAQSVVLSDATAGATIYYTTDGSTPTTLSTVYTTAISVSATKTLKAIAAAANSTQSGVASATYTINLPANMAINLSSGFANSNMITLGYSSIQGSALQLTSGGTVQQSAAWYPSKVNVSGFTTDFNFQLPDSTADGLTFTIQNSTQGYWTMGSNGSGFGYQGINNSVAVAFGLYGASGNVQTVGVYTNGATPTGNSIDMSTAGINLHNGHVYHAHLVCAGSTLTLTLTDTTTGAAFTHAFAVNIASTVGATTAYAGFTGATGAYTSVQQIANWTLAN